MLARLSDEIAARVVREMEAKTPIKEMLEITFIVAHHTGPVANVVPMDVVERARAIVARMEGKGP